MNIPLSHPRYLSLVTRGKLERGVKAGITSINGLIAHGRGEAFDYLLGEQTHEFAIVAMRRAAYLLSHASHPVLSVNGNTAVLVPKELILLGKLLDAPLEVNLFHSSPTRLRNISRYLKTLGARNVLLPDKRYQIPYLASARKYVHPAGIWKADVVFVPLEDGDRTEALVRNGKTVITVDLNPLSRTAQKATVTIVDNITRALPQLIKALKRKEGGTAHGYSNQEILRQAIASLRGSGGR